jgi:hypothetical protein
LRYPESCLLVFYLALEARRPRTESTRLAEILQVGEQFISKYYDVLAKLPKHLHRFYKENSTFSVADVQPDGHAVMGTATGTREVCDTAIYTKVIFQANLLPFRICRKFRRK